MVEKPLYFLVMETIYFQTFENESRQTSMMHSPIGKTDSFGLCSRIRRSTSWRWSFFRALIWSGVTGPDKSLDWLGLLNAVLAWALLGTPSWEQVGVWFRIAFEFEDSACVVQGVVFSKSWTWFTGPGPGWATFGARLWRASWGGAGTWGFGLEAGTNPG